LKTILIVVSYNGINWIDKCLSSCGSCDTIVIDNSSTDNTVNHIRRNYPEVTLIENKANIGFGQANNIGINKALSEGAEYVFLLNQDAYLEKDCVEKLIEVHKANPNYGILSPIHFNGKGDDLDYNFSGYLDKIYDSKWKFNFLSGNFKDVYSLPFVNAAGWLIPKSTIEKVGLFDPMFFHYGEDDNYCQRVRAHDLKVGVVPSANMRHDREGRVRPNISDKLNKDVLERKLKLYLGDINITPDLKAKKRVWRNKIFKSMFKFNFRKFQINLLKYRTLVSVIPKILESRERNKVKC
jgi:GT2 family glycosyltransferase